MKTRHWYSIELERIFSVDKNTTRKIRLNFIIFLWSIRIWHLNSTQFSRSILVYDDVMYQYSTQFRYLFLSIEKFDSKLNTILRSVVFWWSELVQIGCRVLTIFRFQNSVNQHSNLFEIFSLFRVSSTISRLLRSQDLPDVAGYNVSMNILTWDTSQPSRTNYSGRSYHTATFRIYNSIFRTCSGLCSKWPQSKLLVMVVFVFPECVNCGRFFRLVSIFSLWAWRYIIHHMKLDEWYGIFLYLPHFET